MYTEIICQIFSKKKTSSDFWLFFEKKRWMKQLPMLLFGGEETMGSGTVVKSGDSEIKCNYSWDMQIGLSWQ